MSTEVGMRLVGYILDKGSREMPVHWINSPILLADSAVATQIVVNARGVVLNDSTFVILHPGPGPTDWPLLRFTRKAATLTNRASLAGVYRVTGNRGATLWSGSVTLVRAPIFRQTSGGNDYESAIFLELRGADNQALVLAAPCISRLDGFIYVPESVADDGSRVTATGSAVAGQLSLSVDIPLSEGRVLRTVLRGAKR